MEARWIEIFENDHDRGRFGHGIGTWGLRTTQGGRPATRGQDQREINPVSGNLLWAISPKRPGRVSTWPFFLWDGRLLSNPLPNGFFSTRLREWSSTVTLSRWSKSLLS